MSLINSLTSGKNTPTLSPLQSPPPSAIARHPARAQLCLLREGARAKGWVAVRWHLCGHGKAHSLRRKSPRRGRSPAFGWSHIEPPRIVALLAVGTRSTTRIWLRRASPGPWWSTEKAFRTRSSLVLSKAEGTRQHRLQVDCCDDGSTGSNRLEVVSRPRTAGCSETPDRGGQS